MCFNCPLCRARHRDLEFCWGLAGTTAQFAAAAIRYVSMQETYAKPAGIA